MSKNPNRSCLTKGEANGRSHRKWCPERRAAWEAAIAKQECDEEVPLEKHYALLREGMFAGAANADVREEADCFLRYWCRGMNLDPLPWLGPVIAHHWFEMREWDRRWASNRAEKALRDYIAADDFEHWAALNKIAIRLHTEREPFPDALAEWAADVHRHLCDGTFKAPAKERGNEGQPPYANDAGGKVAHVWLCAS